jgi:hypothetical protein
MLLLDQIYTWAQFSNIPVAVTKPNQTFTFPAIGAQIVPAHDRELADIRVPAFWHIRLKSVGF